MTLRAILIAVALLSVDLAAVAQQVTGIAIVEYGIYTAKVDTPPSGANEQMKSARISKICHVQTTSVIPAIDDLHFGFRFRIDGPVRAETVDVTKLVRWSDHMQPAGAPLAYTSNAATRQYRVGQLSYTGWTNWQTMPGTWTFQLFHADRKFAEMKFLVVGRDAVKVNPDSNSTCFLLSGDPASSPMQIARR